MDSETYAYLEIPAFKVQQPLGDFFIIKISAEDLLSISFSEPMEYKDEFGNVKGSQRPKDEKRLKEIARYIDSVEMAFPNSIIIAANYTQNGVVTNDDSERWYVIEDKDCGIHRLIIPKKAKLAAVIDGQHRLTAFEYVTNSERYSQLQLIVSVYFDLPNSYQAFLFATINSNQKRVDRSLALEQFGYNVGEEPEIAWTPEKLAVFLSRKLNIDKENNSPFYKHIRIAPMKGENLFVDGVGNSWVVSTSTIVDGILLLLSANPKRDRIDMQQKSVFSGRKREMISKTKDFSPLRIFFLAGKDQVIYDTVLNYFKAVDTRLWQKANQKSYIFRTVGIQASFDILKIILKTENKKDPDKIDFNKYFGSINIDFSDKFFQASGIGRSRIKNALALSLGLNSVNKIKKTDIPFYTDLLANNNTKGQIEKWPWEEAAEVVVINALEKAQWNYQSKTVNLYLNSDYAITNVIKSYDRLLTVLNEIAEREFVENLPIDNEFSPQQQADFDSEDLVNSLLEDYDDNLKRLGWR
ncbi:DGQHR domain-containing protein [Mucilaginibacter aquaedulcis]|uniref:DGQHR domain-containing protein n=1 Tax=Mucilaginibacter aquaedulcis TaxID=1187081 RepID=UPI0025B2B78D|nr:DGQHR domain-containing protein [Mucilaginibacter aquaedulcis]MDN3548922.1 DGQHR domain-containing protein [Mucilaginibacter aquaedulcis]